MYSLADVRNANKLLKYRQIGIELHQEKLKNIFQHVIERVLAH